MPPYLNKTLIFVKEMRLPVKGRCVTSRMARFTQDLEARISQMRTPPIATSDSTLSTTTRGVSLASTPTHGDSLPDLITTPKAEASVTPEV